MKFYILNHFGNSIFFFSKSSSFFQFQFSTHYTSHYLVAQSYEYYRVSQNFTQLFRNYRKWHRLRRGHLCFRSAVVTIQWQTLKKKDGKDIKIITNCTQPQNHNVNAQLNRAAVAVSSLNYKLEDIDLASRLTPCVPLTLVWLLFICFIVFYFFQFRCRHSPCTHYSKEIDIWNATNCRFRAVFYGGLRFLGLHLWCLRRFTVGCAFDD